MHIGAAIQGSISLLLCYYTTYTIFQLRRCLLPESSHVYLHLQTIVFGVQVSACHESCLSLA